VFRSYPNVYGIDMPSRSELVAYKRSSASIASAIGADLVIFQTLPDLIESVRQFNSSIKTFDCSVFTGEYITGGVDEAYLAQLEGTRADEATKQKLTGGSETAHPNGAIVKGHMNGTHEPHEIVRSGSISSKADDGVGLENVSTTRVNSRRASGDTESSMALHNSWTDAS
jgi:amidophosphoribosyltransferase